MFIHGYLDTFDDNHFWSMNHHNGQVSGGVEAQTEQALKNLKAVVEAGGGSIGRVVKTTVSLC